MTPTPEGIQIMTSDAPSAPAEPQAPAQPEKKESKLKAALWHLMTFVLLVLLITSARWTLADHYQVPTGSMRPTVAIDDRILVNKLSYGVRLPFTSWNLIPFEGPQHGDIVVLDSPESDQTLLKRIVAIPGDQIAVSGGRLFLNGAVVEIKESDNGYEENLNGVQHSVRLTAGGGPDLPPTTLSDDQYLVMGDNRGESRDGRTFGLIPREAIFGKAFGVYWRDGSLTWEDI